MTEQEAFDCGAFAADKGYRWTECPSMDMHLETAWMNGWSSVVCRALSVEEWQRIKRDKGVE